MKKLIVVIPGIMGSNLNKESFTVWPTIFPQNIGLYERYLPIGKENIKPAGLIERVYGKLIDTLNNQPNVIVEPFDYDWRLNNLDNIERLEKLVEKYQHFDEINFVSHSMGGILTKLFLNKCSKNNYIHKVKNVITLGTPWHGSVEAYKTLIYGAGMPWEIAPLLITKETSKIVSKGFPSIYQLLPSEEYCKRVKDGHKVPALSFNDRELEHNEIVNGFEIKEFLESEQHTYTRVFEEFWALLNQTVSELDHINHHEIIGIGNLTLSAIKKNNLGEVSGYFKNGDGTVPIFSAKSNNPSKRYFINDTTHQNLPKNKLVREIIVSIINELEVEEVDGLLFDEKLIRKTGFIGRIVRIACPVRISLVKDGQSIYGFSDDLTVENYEELLRNEYNIISLGSTVYLLFDEKDKRLKDDEKIIIEAYDEGPTNISIEEYKGYEDPKTYSFSTFNIKPSMIAELKISKKVEDVTLDLIEEGDSIKVEQPKVQDLELVLPETDYTIFYAEGNELINEENSQELLVCIDEVSISIDEIKDGTYDVAKTYIKINERLLPVDNNESEVNIHQDLVEGINQIQIFSVDIMGNVEDGEPFNLYYAKEFLPNINFEFLPHQYTIHLTDNDKLRDIKTLIDISLETNIEIKVNINDNVFIDHSNITVIPTKTYSNRTFTITYSTAIGKFVEELTIDEDALMSVFEGIGDSRNFLDFLTGINLSSPEEIKITKIEGTGYLRKINDKNLKNAQRIFLLKNNKKFELIKKSDYIVSFHHLVEDIKIGEMDVYNFSFKVFNESDREITDLDLNGFIKISINEDNPLTDEGDILIKFNPENNLYEGKFNVKIVEKILDGYWENTPIHSSELLITKKGLSSNVLRSKEIKVRKKEPKK